MHHSSEGESACFLLLTFALDAGGFAESLALLLGRFATTTLILCGHEQLGLGHLLLKCCFSLGCQG